MDKLAQPASINQSEDLYDTIIIGAGPAGTAASIYCARKKLKILLITESFGGQSIVSADIRNWIGEKHIMGITLAQKFEEHIRDYSEEVTVKTPEKVVKINTKNCSTPDDRFCDFAVVTDKGGSYLGKSLIICSGAERKKLEVLGEEQYNGKGVAYCSVCDSPLFKDKVVAVVGGGNSGFEAVMDLLKFAKEVYLFEAGSTLRADQVTIDMVKKDPKFKGVYLNCQVTEILGQQLVSGIKLKNTTTNQEAVLAVQGVFIEIGSVPNSEIVRDLVQTDQFGQILVNFAHARTSHPGVFAAGDVTADPYKQNSIAAGDGVRAALAAYAYLNNLQKTSPAAEKN